MAEVIWSGNRDLYLTELDEMHERRDAVLFGQMGWDRAAAGIEQGWDQDEWDTRDAVYLIQKNSRTGRLVAHCRLLRTDRPHMLSTVWAHLCNYPPGLICGPNVLEFTRVCYDWDQMEPGNAYRKWVRASFVTAVTEFCLSQGANGLTFVVTRPHYLNIQAKLWPTLPMGDYVRDPNLGEDLIPVWAEMSPRSLQRVRALLGNDEPVLFYKGPLHTTNLNILKAA